MNGLDDVHHIASLIVVDRKFFLTTDRGIFKYDDSGNRWLPNAVNGSSVPVVAAAPYGSRGILIATSDKDVWAASDVTRSPLEWQSALDPSMMKAAFTIFDVWSNPRNEREIFIAANNQIIYNAQGRALWGANIVPYTFAYSFATVPTLGGDEKLFAGTDVGVVVSIDRRGAEGGDWFTDFEKWIKDHSDDWWLRPFTLISSFIGAYALALFCVLVFKFLPIPPGFIGSEWFISIIGKPLSISPRLGQSFLFVGYRSKLRRRLANKLKAEEYQGYRFERQLIDGQTERSREILFWSSSETRSVQAIWCSSAIQMQRPFQYSLSWRRSRGKV